MVQHYRMKSPDYLAVAVKGMQLGDKTYCLTSDLDIEEFLCAAGLSPEFDWNARLGYVAVFQGNYHFFAKIGDVLVWNADKKKIEIWDEPCFSETFDKMAS